MGRTSNQGFRPGAHLLHRPRGHGHDDGVSLSASAFYSFEMACRSASALTVGAVLLTMSVASGQSSGTSWLDRTLTPWNNAGAAVPKAPAADETEQSGQRPEREDVAGTQGDPDLGEGVDVGQCRITRDPSGVERARRGAEHTVGKDVAFSQGLEHADLYRAEAGATGQHEGDAHVSISADPERTRPRWRAARPVSRRRRGDRGRRDACGTCRWRNPTTVGAASVPPRRGRCQPRRRPRREA